MDHREGGGGYGSLHATPPGASTESRGDVHTGDAIGDGVFLDKNRLTNVGGRGDYDADLVYFLTALEF